MGHHYPHLLRSSLLITTCLPSYTLSTAKAAKSASPPKTAAVTTQDGRGSYHFRFRIREHSFILVDSQTLRIVALMVDHVP
jgi:hypothetical protein